VSFIRGSEAVNVIKDNWLCRFLEWTAKWAALRLLLGHSHQITSRPRLSAIADFRFDGFDLFSRNG